MPQISMKKVLIAILIIILLSRLDKVFAFASGLYQAIVDSFEPLRRCSAEMKYLVLIAFFALLYITIFKLLYKRM